MSQEAGVVWIGNLIFTVKFLNFLVAVIIYYVSISLELGFYSTCKFLLSATI